MLIEQNPLQAFQISSFTKGLQWPSNLIHGTNFNEVVLSKGRDCSRYAKNLTPRKLFQVKRLVCVNHSTSPLLFRQVIKIDKLTEVSSLVAQSIKPQQYKVKTTIVAGRAPILVAPS